MGVCDVPVISAVCDTAGEAAASLVVAPFEWLAQAVGEAAGWLFEAVWVVFDTTTLVDVRSPEYVSVYNLLFGIAAFVMLLFFCLQLVTGLVRRDPTALSRAVLGLAKSVLGSFVVITLTGLLLEIVDQLSLGIVQAAGETTASMGDKIVLLVAALGSVNIAGPGVGAILTIFFASLAISAAAIVWLSLLVRKALLLVAIVLAPLAFSGSSWDAARGWIGKWSMFVIALIVSKLVLVVMFLVAITQISAPIDADLASISDPIAGIVLMAMAAFAPYLTYKFIAFVGLDFYHAIGSEQDAKQALNRPVPTPTSPQGADPKKVLDGAGDANNGGGGSGGGPTPPPPPPPPPGGSAGAAGAGSPAAGAGSGAAGAGGAGAAGAGAGGAGAAGAGAAAAGPAAAVVVAAQVAKGAAEAGPKAGATLAAQADTAADGAQQPGNQAAQAPPPPASDAPPAPRAAPSQASPHDSSAASPPAPRQSPPPAPRPTGKE